MLDEHNETIKEFLVESFENLDRLDQEFIALEKDPQNTKILQSIFRTVHSLKGTSSFLNFSKLESVAHVGESLLDGLRAARISLTPDITSALLELVDALRTILKCIESTRADGDEDYRPLKERLSKFAQASGAKSSTETPRSAEASAESSVAPVVEKAAEDDLEAMFRAAQQDYAAREAAASPLESTSQPTSSSEGKEPTSVNNETSSTTQSTDVKRSTNETPTPGASAAEGASSGLAETSLRVDVALLDQLMNLVGELVLARNQILQFTKTQSDSTFVSTSQRLDLITSELQEGVMKTRMQPIVNVWNKFPRIVRDVGRALGKQVRIEMQGKETDLDKTIIEAIKDPLTHLVRNSVDHGIEIPAERTAKGKDPEGKLLLKAFHEGGNVIIEIADDGAGLNTAKIKSKAIERGILTPERAARMTEQELNRLIFLAGFSTADKVTNISGRGVGMDVVRSNIEKIGGNVDVVSYPNQGTTIKIKIPLTLAIVPALIVTSGGERFAIPQVSLLELVRIEGNNVRKQVEEVGGRRFYRLRGNLLPLVYLNSELKLRGAGTETSGDAHPVVNIVVVKAEDQQFGLVVDAVHDTEEIVVKPLGRQLKDISVLAGATIMGDGHVALILDILGVAHRAGVLSEHRGDGTEAATSEVAVTDSDKQSLLIVQAGEGFRAAIPLALVNRLEEFPAKTVERAAGCRVVQYRGGLLPLVDLPEYFTGVATSDTQVRQVVVFNGAQGNVGFVVERIIDIVEDSVVLEREHIRRGIQGSAVIREQTTDLLDLPAILQDTNVSLEGEVSTPTP